MLKFYKILFFNSLVLGTLIAISSYSWMSMWMGLEINLLSFIPLINSSKNMYASEASIKYFLTQALASIILLFSIIALLMLNEFITPLVNQMMLLTMNSALLTKLGAAPFHFWFPEVMEGLNWMNSLILLTWQKIAPMILIMNNMPSTTLMFIVIIASTMVSGLMGMNQISLRKILTFSSINHIAWMLSATLVSNSMWTMYFITYSILTINIIYCFHSIKALFIKQLINSMNHNKTFKLLVLTNFLSLGGLPPFLGFLPKWLVVSALVSKSMHMIALIIIIFTLISLYIYIRVIASSMIILTTESAITTKTPKNTFMIGMNLTSSLLILLSTLMFNFL